MIGPLTWSLVRDFIDAEPLGAVPVKGFTHPVISYRLVAAPLESAGATLLAPMVGRDTELTSLQRAFAAAVRERSGRLVTLIGAAGVGKSRLTHEFVASIRPQATVLRGQCLPYGEGITYWPIAMAVRSAAGIEDIDDHAAATSKLESYVAELPASTRIAAQLASAIGLGLTLAPREEIGWAVRRLLEGKAGARPCVLVVDDIQWAEETLLDLLEIDRHPHRRRTHPRTVHRQTGAVRGASGLGHRRTRGGNGPTRAAAGRGDVEPHRGPGGNWRVTGPGG